SGQARAGDGAVATVPRGGPRWNAEPPIAVCLGGHHHQIDAALPGSADPPGADSAKVILNVVPRPGALRKAMIAPWSSMILCVRARPSPVPPPFVVKNGLKILLASDAGMPRPVSSISSATRRRPYARLGVVFPLPSSLHPARSVSRPPAAIASSALPTRFTRA